MTASGKNRAGNAGTGTFFLFRTCPLPALLFAMAFLACTRPAVSEQFVRSDEAAGGLYYFTPDFADTLAFYDLSFYTAAQTVPLCLEVSWMEDEAPAFHTETVWMKPGEVQQLYRSKLQPGHSARWRLKVKVLNQPERFPGICIITKRYDGTR